MSSLTRLELSGNSHLPSCLSTLTRLRSLEISSVEADADDVDADALERALSQLQQLTRLYLWHPDLAASPAALASLTQLHSLYWSPQPQPDAALPPGTWLAQLQAVAASWEVLSRSLPALSGAAGLQILAFTDSVPDADAVCTVLDWAAEQPGLLRLIFAEEPPLSGEALQTALSAARGNLNFAIEFEEVWELPVFSQG